MKSKKSLVYLEFVIEIGMFNQHAQQVAMGYMKD